MSDGVQPNQEVQHSNCLEIIDHLHIGDDAAAELAKELSDPLGLVKDLSYDGVHMIVRWPEEDDE